MWHSTCSFSAECRLLSFFFPFSFFFSLSFFFALSLSFFVTLSLSFLSSLSLFYPSPLSLLPFYSASPPYLIQYITGGLNVLILHRHAFLVFVAILVLCSGTAPRPRYKETAPMLCCLTQLPRRWWGGARPWNMATCFFQQPAEHQPVEVPSLQYSQCCVSYISFVLNRSFSHFLLTLTVLHHTTGTHSSGLHNSLFVYMYEGRTWLFVCKHVWRPYMTVCL